MQAKINNMTFTENDKLKALAIVHIFETSRPFGDYAAVAVLNDGAGVSYGINQFTHRSGSLAAVVEAYLKGGGKIGRDIFASALPALRRNSVSAVNAFAADERFKKALQAAAVTREMKEAQNTVAFEKYLGPAMDICGERGFVTPLSLAVIYDSLTHGSWGKIEESVHPPTDRTQNFEQAWITEYVRKRHFWLTNVSRLKATNYRTKFFLDQIAIGNWELRLPIMVHGVRLTEAVMQDAETPGHRDTASVSATGTAKTEVISDAISSATNEFDRVDAVVTGVVTRTDRAKSLWTTVIGTISQAIWAVFGFLIGLPKVVWIVVAVIAAVLMLTYLYRQITLGKIRERTTPSVAAAATPPL